MGKGQMNRDEGIKIDWTLDQGRYGKIEKQRDTVSPSTVRSNRIAKLDYKCSRFDGLNSFAVGCGFCRVNDSLWQPCVLAFFVARAGGRGSARGIGVGEAFIEQAKVFRGHLGCIFCVGGL